MQKTSILPATVASLSSDEILSNLLYNLEQFVSDSLDAPEACGVLQKDNCVDIEDLVNTAAEMIEGEELSEKEICIAVLQQHVEENATVVDDSNDEEKVLPAHKEALNVIATLQRYISGLDGNFTCQMKQVLADFGCQTCLEELRNFEDTALTDYFTST